MFHAFQQVVGEYPADCQPRHTESLGSAGGFSGARFWRLATPRGLLCLRRWPREHPSCQRLEFIHNVLAHAGRQGIDYLALPLASRTGTSYVRHAGYLWELTPWLPGRADYRAAPSPARLRAALEALGRFHQAAASYPMPTEPRGPSPGISSRLEKVRGWRPDRLERLSLALETVDWLELNRCARQLLPLVPRLLAGIEPLLARASRLTVSLQPCIRDVWHDHLLFQGDRVSGIVDFGALRIESIAADVARLLGSLVDDDQVGWHTGLAAYEQLRPLSAEELQLVHAFDRANVALMGLTWLGWIAEEGRIFENHEAVIQRLRRNLARLARLGDSAGSEPS